MSLALIIALVVAQSKPAYLANDGLLIGYRKGGTWHSAEHLPSSHAPITLKHIGFGVISQPLTAKGIVHVTDNGPEEVALDGDDSAMKGVVFSGKASVPRPVHVLSNQSEFVVKVMSAFLQAHGIKSKTRLTRVIAADLDGDGTVETILEASSRDDLLQGGMSAARYGDYSVVLLHSIRNGKVIDRPLLFDHPALGKMPFLDKIVAVASFDGNGTMDLVLTSNYYEGTSTRLLRYRHGKVTKLAQNGVGV